jgi:hypothetical protein
VTVHTQVCDAYLRPSIEKEKHFKLCILAFTQ